MKKFKRFIRMCILACVVLMGSSNIHASSVMPVKVNVTVPRVNVKNSCSNNPDEALGKIRMYWRETMIAIKPFMDSSYENESYKRLCIEDGIKVPELCYSQEDKERMESIQQRNADGIFIGVDDLIWFSQMMGTTIELRDAVREIKSHR